jgi:hypothetical protein
VTWVDLPTSHWPMWSRPRELAAIIGDVARAHASADWDVSPGSVRQTRHGCVDEVAAVDAGAARQVTRPVRNREAPVAEPQLD